MLVCEVRRVLARRCRASNQSYKVVYQASQAHCISGRGATLLVLRGTLALFVESLKPYSCAYCCFVESYHFGAQLKHKMSAFISVWLLFPSCFNKQTTGLITQTLKQALCFCISWRKCMKKKLRGNVFFQLCWFKHGSQVNEVALTPSITLTALI